MHFNPSKRITVQTDGCANGLGTAALFQDNQPVLFASRTLTDVGWLHEFLFLGIVFAVTRFRLHLPRINFTVQTDHLPITGLWTKIQPWLIAIQQYSCTVEQITGKDNVVADALFRNAVVPAVSEPENVAEVTNLYCAFVHTGEVT